jgi:hypothetical protein
MLLALELAQELEAERREGHLYLVDGTPDFTKSVFQHIMGTNEEQFETNFMYAIYKVIAPNVATSEAVRKVFLIFKFEIMQSHASKLQGSNMPTQQKYQGAKVAAEERSEATWIQNSKREQNHLLIKINSKF